MSRLSDFDVIDTIYEGNNTHVYRAVRTSDNNPVILKTTATTRPTPGQVARYRHEYRILQSIKPEQAPHVVHGLDLVEHDHRPYLVLEDMGGVDLRSLIQPGSMDLAQGLDIAVEIASALGEIYQFGIVHKDIKPANILFNAENGDVRLIDFSSASVISRETPTVETSMLMTATLPYMSPEQTGRMNRMVDWRTDYYSLGVTLYELFTGRLPFDMTDPLELVHAHMALMPKPPHEMDRNIPAVLSDIISKLMAKDAEDRYQSALGIVHDLMSCRDQLVDTGRVDAFEIAQKDISDRLQIPQKLYGREQEIEDLLKGFKQVCSVACKMVLVKGPAGIGKSALVREVQSAILRNPTGHQKPYFISGKFDQLKRSIPYAPLINAFQEMIRQILSESDAAIADWKLNLLKALGPNGQVMIEVIPELELIIGEQPEVPSVGPMENVNRFNYVFENFIRTFAAKEHPLIIFLDDLQWSDAASLKLIEMFITVQTEYLFLIGAYRDNEVDAAHPLIFALDEIWKSGAEIETILLDQLKEDHVDQLLSETLSCDPEQSKPLTRLCFEKTLGNPFFLNQFIHSLYRDGLIVFSAENGLWQWDEIGIRQTDISGNVVELMINRIQGLSENTAHILSLAACIGNRFDLNLLSAVYGKSVQETSDDLFEALQKELVLPVDESYKYVSGTFEAQPLENVRPGTKPPTYEFIHDRVQQAAYSLIGKKEKPEVHLKTGREILKTISEDALEEQIFSVVDQLNLGSALIDDEAERENLAELNLVAGKKSKLSAAFEPAFAYLKFGISLLKKNSWKEQYSLTMAIHEEAVEAAFLCSDFSQMENLAEIGLQQAKTVLDTGKLYELKIKACFSQNKVQDSIRIGLSVLKLLGFMLPENPNKFDIMLAYLRLRILFYGKSVDFIKHQKMTDPYKIMSLRILTCVSIPAYIGAPKLISLGIFKSVLLSLGYGNAPDSAYFYNAYGLILCGVIGEINKGFEFGNMALRLLDKTDEREFGVSVRTQFSFNVCVRHWKQHLRRIISPLEIIFKKGLETGDFEIAAYAAFATNSHSYFAGIELDRIEKWISKYYELIKKTGQRTFSLYLEGTWQLVINLKKPCENPTIITGDICNEEDLIKSYRKENNILGLCGHHIYKLTLCCIFGTFKEGVENAMIAEKHLQGLVSSITVPIFHFYDSFTHLAVFHESQKPKQKQILRKISKNQKKMKKWAHHAPMNYLHKWQLVEAERARVLGKDEKAKSFYDQAISGAKENKYIQEEALANELVAKFYLAKGETETARKYMKQARYCYDHWGAKAKVDHLDQNYPELLADVSTQPVEDTTMEKTAKADPSKTSTSTGPVKSGQLDLASVMKASQVISGEIEIQKLLSRMMRIILENAGAEKGCLILKSGEGFRIEAEGNIHQDNIRVLQSIPVENAPQVPGAIIQYVIRTKENLVLNDAAKQGKFTSDPYINQHQPKSILCAPLIHQKNVSGVIYLENNLTTGAFTQDRLEVLSLLCSQAAISLENANLYKKQQDYAGTLEATVQERTRELKQSLDTIQKTQEQLVQSEKMAAIGGLVAGVAHEINTPIGIAVSAASHLEDKTGEFVKKVESKKIKRSELDSYAKTASDSSNLILKNLSGAVKIVQGFKQVAVDQTSGERREFKLKPYIEDVLLSLKPKLKKTQHVVTVNCPEDLTLNSFPGALSQIISNLVMNSLIHGFEGIEQGEITFDAAEENGSVTLTYRDNGKGMDEKTLSKIFDPFFTTKRSQGGSGLGMHIVHNLVTQTLEGAISCESQPGNGMMINMKVPMSKA